FSSRRRHTRFSRDWSSDVCSSDLLKIHVLNKFTEDSELPKFLESCLSGINVGLLSEAGCPGIADPGADVVKLAHQLNIKVVPLRSEERRVGKEWADREQPHDLVVK